MKTIEIIVSPYGWLDGKPNGGGSCASYVVPDATVKAACHDLADMLVRPTRDLCYDP